MRPIFLKNVSVHNLKSVSLELAPRQLIVFSGVSGSGKSSLAFDTLYVEGQRRYVESLGTFARRQLGEMSKPDLELASGISPTISIEQKTTGRNPRSTVGTITEIYDYLRVLYARIGVPHCPVSGEPVTPQSRERIIKSVQTMPEGKKIILLAPFAKGKKGEFKEDFQDLVRKGFTRVRVDGSIIELDGEISLDGTVSHDVDIVVDRLTVEKENFSRLAEAVTQALTLSNGLMSVVDRQTEEEQLFSMHAFSPRSGLSYSSLEPQDFSFNSPAGMCTYCNGLGSVQEFDLEQIINPDLSIAEDCCSLGSSYQTVRFGNIYDNLAELYNFSVHTPWKKLSEKGKKVFLYGTEKKWTRMHFTHPVTGAAWTDHVQWRGILYEAKSRLAEAKSEIYHKKMAHLMQEQVCPECRGERLKPYPAATLLNGQRIAEVTAMTIEEAAKFFSTLSLTKQEKLIGEELLKEIQQRLHFLLEVGLGYLTLNRTSPTLSGGEAQRVRLASQIGSGLVGITYVLDEPSIGLHPRDNKKLIDTLKHLRDRGNTVVVVEHDEETLFAADKIVDFGPGAGSRGGEIIVNGTLKELVQSDRSLTGQYLSGTLSIPIPKKRRKKKKAALTIVGATHHNLKQVTVAIPLGLFVAVTGVSGSGKSSLITDILYPALANALHRADHKVGAHQTIKGIDEIDKVIAIDQSPIGRNPRSNPATYIKLFDEIRDLFTKLPESLARGYKPGRFSFNVKEGSCPQCEGMGMVKIDMDFMEDAWIECSTCRGRRFDEETLSIFYKGKTIYDILEMEVGEALNFFDAIPSIKQKLETLKKVGLDYLKLGQSSTTLSGGEAQRIKLAKELVRPATGNTLYIFDEPTTGLHFHDIFHLSSVLDELVERGNTVLVIEHNMDIVKTADWIIDIGPEGGAQGGEVVATGTPEQIAKLDTPTGHAVDHALYYKRKEAIQELLRQEKKSSTPKETDATVSRIILETTVQDDKVMQDFESESLPMKVEHSQKVKATSIGSDYSSKDCVNLSSSTAVSRIIVLGAEQNNLKHIDAEIPRNKITLCTGPSGSGKSSFAFDTVYAEGQRRYIESLSPYARQFVTQMAKPRVSYIEGLSPAIAIEQKVHAGNPRSTVGTMTEIYDYLRILYAKVGIPHCPETKEPIRSISKDYVADRLLQMKVGERIQILSPITIKKNESIDLLLARLQRTGFLKVRLNGTYYDVDDEALKLAFDKKRKNDLFLVVDRLKVSPGIRHRLLEALDHGSKLGEGKIIVAKDEEDIFFNFSFAVESTGKSYPPITPHTFAFNHAQGMCPDCQGLGYQYGANLVSHEEIMYHSPATLMRLLWDERNEVGERLLKLFLEKERIDPFEPLSQLSSDKLNKLLNGSSADVWYESGLGYAFRWVGINPLLAKVGKHGRAEIKELVLPLLDEIECPSCSGARLNPLARHVTINDLSISDFCALPIGKARAFIDTLSIDPQDAKLLEDVVKHLRSKLAFLEEIGLDYLSLDRRAPTLSGGETQRIRLARQLGSGLTGVLYVLDEPTIGLHPKDSHKLHEALTKLKELGNTLLMVEHDPDTIAQADYILDFGPHAGEKGGHITARGTFEEIKKDPHSLTGRYLSGELSIPAPKKRKAKGKLTMHNASLHNLKQIDVPIPLGVMTCVVGVSGSGKSTLINDLLLPAVKQGLGKGNTTTYKACRVTGLDQLDKIIAIDQNPIGLTARSDVGTYVDILARMREFFASLPASKAKGLQGKHFSYNHRRGMCTHCWGMGYKKVEMHFLPPVEVTCEECHGLRLNPVSLTVLYKGKNFGEYLQMTVDEVRAIFADHPRIVRLLDTLISVGLGYLKLGQEMATLSGGEAQRIKLSRELGKRATGKTLYLLDEPTTGLHMDDIKKLLSVLHRLVDQGNTMVIIEHNQEMIRHADNIIELGPGGGDRGGRVIHNF